MSLDIEIVCTICENTLDGEWSTRANNYIIDPCDKCLMDAKDEGIDEGYEKRQAEEE